jgi:hypothetical protein
LRRRRCSPRCFSCMPRPAIVPRCFQHAACTAIPRSKCEAPGRCPFAGAARPRPRENAVQ